MENCYSLQESELFSKILNSIKRNEHGLLDFIVQDILRDKNFKDLLDREIEIEKEPEELETGMVIKIDLSREGVPDNTFRLYLSGNGTILIDWGDGTSLEVDLDTSGVNFYEHQYENVGNYTVKVYGQEDFPGQEISFGSGELFENYYNRAIEEIESWGDLRLVSLSGALSYTIGPLTVPKELPSTVTDLSYLLQGSTVSEVINMQNWNTSNVTDMSWMFYEAKGFNGNISSWDTSKVKDMSHMFRGAENFNGDISDWNTSKVTDMSHMFHRAISFDQSLRRDGDIWNTSNVENMSHMFYLAENFDGDISNWNTSNVTNMSSMFRHAENFNGDISNWNTSKVTDMSRMFQGAVEFNGDISKWDTSKVTDMSHMFQGATKFNQDLIRDGNIWNTSNVEDMNNMFYEARSFDGDISSWNTCSVREMHYMFYGAENFNRNLSSWKVPHINPPGPFNFATDSPLGADPSKHPDWGASC